MTTNPYGDHGNKDVSITNPRGVGTLTPIEDTGPAIPAPKDKQGGPFLCGDQMTGGYGKTGPNILHDCTIAVEKGEIAVIVGPNGAGKSTAMKAVFGMLNLREGAVFGHQPPFSTGAGAQRDGVCAADTEYLSLAVGGRKP